MARTHYTGIKITWSTGFSFIIDFVENNLNEALYKWEQYYSDRPRKPEITFKHFIDDSIINAYSSIAISVFSKRFDQLDCEDKIKVVEMAKEKVFQEVC